MKTVFSLNGKPASIDIPSDTVLLTILREEFDLTGAKPGCETGSCGACSVIIDGERKNSCTYPAAELEGRTVITIEGLLSPNGSPNDLQLAFLAHGATQCGYCTPGMIMTGEALLRANPSPNRRDIREALAGNLCRCTGYLQIIDAIETVAQTRMAQREST